VFHQDIQTLGELKIQRATKFFFDEGRVVWITDKTLSQVFDISSQWNQKLRSKRGGEKSSKSMLMRPVISKPLSRFSFCLSLRMIREGPT